VNNLLFIKWKFFFKITKKNGFCSPICHTNEHYDKSEKKQKQILQAVSLMLFQPEATPQEKFNPNIIFFGM
jgi:hypothetical protein